MTKLGLVGDRHYSTYAEEVRRLEREGDLDYAEALLLYLVEATEAEAKANRQAVAPWYYERLAIIYRKNKESAAEMAILERYERHAEAYGAGSPKLARRLAGLRAKAFDNDEHSKTRKQEKTPV